MTRKKPAPQQKPTGTRKRAAERSIGDIATTAPETGAQVTPDPDPPDAAAAAMAGPGPVILIEIDPGVSGGFVHGRFDVMIRGRVVSESPIEEVRLQVGDWVTSTASFGQPERAAIGIMPDGTQGRQRGFKFNLPRPGDGGAERCAFQIIARTEDGFEHAEDFEIDVDPTAGDPVAVVSGPAGATATVVRPYVEMYIECGTIDADGTLSVQGWAVSLGPTLAVQIFADEERISKARIGGDRDDVASAFPAYPNARLSGFSLTLQLDDVDRDASRIRAQIVCPNGFGHEESIPVERLLRRSAPRPQRAAATAASPPPSPTFSLFNQQPIYQLSADFLIADDPLFGLVLPGSNPGAAPGAVVMSSSGSNPVLEEAPAPISMHCDTATLTGDGILSLEGWAVCAAGIVQIRVLLNDDDVGLASVGHDRADVGEIFPQIPISRLAGFQFEQRVGDFFTGTSGWSRRR